MKKNISKQCDSIVMMSIFVVILMYVINVFLFKNTEVEAIKEYGYTHLYTIQATLTEMIFAGVLLWKCYRLKACSLTKITTWMYLAIVLTSLLYVVISLPFYPIFQIIQYILIFGISVSFLTFLMKKWIG